MAIGVMLFLMAFCSGEGIGESVGEAVGVRVEDDSIVVGMSVSFVGELIANGAACSDD
jgi:hypothetical protein